MNKLLGIALVSLALAAGGSHASAQACDAEDEAALECGGDSLGGIVTACMQSPDCVLFLMMGDTEGLIQCTADCFADHFPEVQDTCVDCFKDLADCGLINDCAACAQSLCSPDCVACVEDTGCRAEFDACTGGGIGDYCEVPTCG